ncbi:MAG: hypothetical protein JO316_15010 [Abitibacteriaceae bacterium]|nr:hypothetical protein [Abditibacteriaceae bacterium]MBV9866661.1 hypothetical protein [Abditibacteriaceae bacterium]
MFKILRPLKFLYLYLLFMVVAVSCSVGATPINTDDYKGTIRVACVGDSITYGDHIQDREHKSYPAQLGQMLGDKWAVKNFGVNGATLLSKGNAPYNKVTAYQQALDFKPDVLIIMLGTNDSKPENWQHRDDFTSDYKQMIATFRKVSPDVKVYTCLPVPAFPGQWGINDTIIKNEVIPLVQQVAKDTNATVIDLYSALSGKKELFPDTVHPNAEGARLIAIRVYQALTGKAALTEAGY